jgi:hypothetical protein
MSNHSMDINQQNENLQPSIESNQEKDPVQAIATGLGVVSGGLAGAMIGRWSLVVLVLPLVRWLVVSRVLMWGVMRLRGLINGSLT